MNRNINKRKKIGREEGRPKTKTKKTFRKRKIQKQEKRIKQEINRKGNTKNKPTRQTDNHTPKSTIPTKPCTENSTIKKKEKESLQCKNMKG